MNMTQDEIIEMAREAGFVVTHIGDPIGTNYTMIEAFANLVAAKAFQNGYEKGIAGFNEAVGLEREACAQVAFSWNQDITDIVALEIRARGEQALAQPKQDGDCKKCTDGCPACDARKLQKEAHDLL